MGGTDKTHRRREQGAVWWAKWRLAVLLGGIGLAMVAVGLFADWSQWPVLLAQAGTVLAFFGLLFQAERWLERSIRDVADDTATLERRVATLDEDLSEAREELVALRDAGDATRDHLAAERARVDGLFEAFGDEPSVESLLAMFESTGGSAVSEGGIRVSVPGTDSWLRVRQPTRRVRWQPQAHGASGEEAHLVQCKLRIENAAGSRQGAPVQWESGQNVVSLGVAVATTLAAAGDYPGDEHFDIGVLLMRVRNDLRWLTENRRFRSDTSDMAPVIELPNEQWAITDDGLACRTRLYYLNWSQLDDLGWVYEKSWVDRDQLEAAQGLALSLRDVELARQEPVPF